MTEGSSPKKRKRATLSYSDRYLAFCDGRLDISELDDEELTQGRLRSEAGDFRGRPPQLIPRSFHQAVVRELVARQERKLLPDLENGYEVLRTVANNPRAAGRDRVTAAIYLIERVSGKIPEKQIVEAQVRKWEQDVGGLLADIGED